MSTPLVAEQRSARSNPLFMCCALLPAVAVSALYLFSARACLLLGHWPRPHLDDPKDLGFELHRVAIYLLLTAALTSPIAVMLLLILRASGLIKSLCTNATLVGYAVGYLAVLIVLRFDPGRVFEWFCD